MHSVIYRVAAGITGLLLATVVPASAAGTTGGAAAGITGWRVIKIFSQAESSGIGVTATSASDAWSIWWNEASTGPAAFVERYDGSAWRQVPVPESLINDVLDTLSVGASTATNVWDFWGSVPDGTGAIRWNGHTWRSVQLPGFVIRVSPDPADNPNAQAVVFGPNTVWVFSIGSATEFTPDHFAARYNGRNWTKVALPATPVWISALAPNDIWGLGPAAGGRHPEVLMHYNGTRWGTTPPVPGVKLASGDVGYVNELTATGPRDAWLQQGVLLRSGNNGAPLYLLHWNGTRWAKIKFGVRVSQVDDAAQDGHGGLWLIDQGPAPARHWYIDHLNAGHWTRYAVPAVRGMTLEDLSSITLIPGTRSMLVTGDLSKGHGNYGLVLKFGP
jgi:hypothetical protein